MLPLRLLQKPLLKKPLPPPKRLPKLLQSSTMRVLKSYGAEGGVIASVNPHDIDIEEPVFINFDELPVPFFIEHIKPHGATKSFIKFEDIDTLEDAEELVGREIYFEEDYYDDDGSLIGLTLFDASGKEIGPVTEYIDIPSNPCIEVEHAGERKLIPCHEDLVRKIDPENRRIYIEIAEGLL